MLSYQTIRTETTTNKNPTLAINVSHSRNASASSNNTAALQPNVLACQVTYGSTLYVICSVQRLRSAYIFTKTKSNSSSATCGIMQGLKRIIMLEAYEAVSVKGENAHLDANNEGYLQHSQFEV
mmetsp:Transcript_28407/g.86839  ORF Transcript_28407/g.86839 Transcript_28407/m.86839 type:complete len:124 (+) Transcript_28407:48-419(+)